ncbi:hypothetical protein MIND_00396900 [Mycena indigotica]|uniref:Uncharacterized protein n=1 Tax=Mycena indigotica TaxID=2126181 RepID=A0A8H6WA01_9AGAR|nr:uncharacterized protein MIND_00396900 [Mycena indigotica]KAF7310232.1 hypothetical protein MIND_00396900 [Mycena indigotica]
MSEPRLPPEIEREIFETTAISSPRMCYPLLRVARRVCAWIEPMLYRTLMFHERSTSADLDKLSVAKSREYLARNVRHVIVSATWPGPGTAAEALRLFPGATHLALGNGHFEDDQQDALQAAFTDLRLHRLVCYANAVFPTRDALMAAAALPVFAQLTHLSLFDIGWTEQQELFYATLPALTHLAPPHLTSWRTFERLLRPQACRRLEALVVFSHTDVPQGFADVRLVITIAKPWSFGDSEETWAEGVFEVGSFWDVADDFIARKRAGLIPVNNYIAVRDMDSWNFGQQ